MKDPYQRGLHGRNDAFLTVLAPSGKNLIESTCLGGRYEEFRGAIALDGAGGIYVTGMTNSPDFPVLKPFQKTLAGDFDAFVLKFTPTK
ncbi:MAG: SBBP repeat-containing protein [Candidatus Aminicenantes bacterium]|nr:SBBP repeat-containing protein [Candidatus Aminicenantes bacterium]